MTSDLIQVNACGVYYGSLRRHGEDPAAFVEYVKKRMAAPSLAPLIDISAGRIYCANRSLYLDLEVRFDGRPASKAYSLSELVGSGTDPYFCFAEAKNPPQIFCYYGLEPVYRQDNHRHLDNFVFESANVIDSIYRQAGMCYNPNPVGAAHIDPISGRVLSGTHRDYPMMHWEVRSGSFETAFTKPHMRWALEPKSEELFRAPGIGLAVGKKQAVVIHNHRVNIYDLTDMKITESTPYLHLISYWADTIESSMILLGSEQGVLRVLDLHDGKETRLTQTRDLLRGGAFFHICHPGFMALHQGMDADPVDTSTSLLESYLTLELGHEPVFLHSDSSGISPYYAYDSWYRSTKRIGPYWGYNNFILYIGPVAAAIERGTHSVSLVDIQTGEEIDTMSSKVGQAISLSSHAFSHHTSVEEKLKERSPILFFRDSIILRGADALMSFPLQSIMGRAEQGHPA